VSGSPMSDEAIECPLCLGEGKLKRTEILDRLGVKDFARVAQLSAEEAFRLLQSKHEREHQTAWSRFETELTKRTAEIRERHKDELRSAQSERDDLIRRVEDCLREVAQVRERNQRLEAEMAKVAHVGKREEMDFYRKPALGLVSQSVRSSQRTATSCWRIAIPAALHWNLALSWTTKTKPLSRRAISGS
jgi:hypothetical protein